MKAPISDLEEFKKQLRLGASLNGVDSEGKTLLQLAIEHDLPEHASLLILNGCKVPEYLLQNTAVIVNINSAATAINDSENSKQEHRYN